MAAEKIAITREEALLEVRKYVAAYARVPERSEEIDAARGASARSLAQLPWDEDE
ncbi:MAG: hypothetical protein M3Y87_04075 [Myxococcota bacterium]|nr:hypothetical protein [Myxococcota bacterium]